MTIGDRVWSRREHLYGTIQSGTSPLWWVRLDDRPTEPLPIPEEYLALVLEKDKMADTSHDPVHHPAHYTQGGVDCLDAIRASMSQEEWYGYCKGNAIKYLWRYRHKHGKEDLEKSKFYLCQLLGCLPDP